MNARRTRTWLRILHLVVGSAMATYVYWPAGQAPVLQSALAAVGVPLVVLSGVAIWQQAKLRRLAAAVSPRVGRRSRPGHLRA